MHRRNTRGLRESPWTVPLPRNGTSGVLPLGVHTWVVAPAYRSWITSMQSSGTPSCLIVA